MTLKSLVLRILLGPLVLLRRRPILAVCIFLLVVLLTVVTQIGGVLLWFAFVPLRHRYRRARKLGWFPAGAWAVMSYVILYVLAAVVAVPPLAEKFGRKPLPCDIVGVDASNAFAAVNPLFCMANRHYAAPSIHRMLDGLSQYMDGQFPGSVVIYLDAGFPFFDGFPLPPHLSHHDGRKIDLAFFYKGKITKREIARAGAWWPGYGVFARARPAEPTPCRGKGGRFRWNYGNGIVADYGESMTLDLVRTGAMVSWLVEHADLYGVEKMFLEPHLKQRMGITSDIVRFQGCHAARHDDHLHVQMRPPGPPTIEHATRIGYLSR